MWKPGGEWREVKEEEAVTMTGGLSKEEMILEQNFIFIFLSTGLQSLRRQVGSGSSSVYPI